MPTPKKKKVVGTSGVELSQYQKYRTQVVPRADIHEVEYNPRIISEDARKRLGKVLKKHGLVEPLVWNKRTNNLVSGHRRIEWLDTLEKTDQYALEVAVVDVDAKEEKELNILLNNPSIQGEYDFAKLDELRLEEQIDMSDLGFSDAEIDAFFQGGELYEITSMSDGEAEAIEDFTEGYDAEYDAKKEERERQKKIEQFKKQKEGTGYREDEATAEFYSMIIFKSPQEKAKFNHLIGVGEFDTYLQFDQISSFFIKEENDG